MNLPPLEGSSVQRPPRLPPIYERSNTMEDEEEEQIPPFTEEYYYENGQEFGMNGEELCSSLSTVASSRSALHVYSDDINV